MSLVEACLRERTQNENNEMYCNRVSNEVQIETVTKYNAKSRL